MKEFVGKTIGGIIYVPNNMAHYFQGLYLQSILWKNPSERRYSNYGIKMKYKTNSLMRESKFKIIEAVVKRCSVKKVFLEILQKFTGKDLCQCLFLVKLQASGLQLD